MRTSCLATKASSNPSPTGNRVIQAGRLKGKVALITGGDSGIAPGPILTPLNPCGGRNPKDIPEFGKDTPMGRPGQPNEVAPSFLFLACEDSSYLIGQVLHPNGGDFTSS